jgi:small subunit ribosomal protein S15
LFEIKKFDGGNKMARMHSRKKGKSGSVRPLQKSKLTWIRYSKNEVEMIIVKLAKDGKQMSEIGSILRDTYGIPCVKTLTASTIKQILEKKNLTSEIPEDLKNLIRKLVALQKHQETNKQDMTAKRGFQLTESKIMRLVKYYKRSGELPSTWKYDPKNVAMYV